MAVCGFTPKFGLPVIQGLKINGRFYMSSENLEPQVSSSIEQSNQSNQQIPDGYLSNERANSLIKKAKDEAYERARAELASQQTQPNQSYQQQQAQNFLTEEKLNERLQQMQDQYVVNQMLTQHQKTIDQGKQEYPDFDEVTSSINVRATPAWIPLLNSLPNGSDVFYELGKDDRRFMDVQIALATGQNAKAERMLKTMSESIAANKTAKQQSHSSAPAPLSKVKPSTANADNGQMSFADMQAAVKKNIRR